jgi:hypothetical protein
MAEIHRLTIQIAQPGGRRFPLRCVETGYWYEEGDCVFLCDQTGVRTGNKCEIPKGVDAKTIAIRLLKSAVGRRSGGFNRELIYQF